MKKKKILACFLIAIGICYSFTYKVNAAGPTEVTSDISVATTWTKNNNPYIIRKQIKVNAQLTIEPGVVVKFDNNIYSRGGLSVYKKFIAIGTENEKIIFTSLTDDKYGGDDNNDGDGSYPNWYDWRGISVVKGNEDAIFDYVVISHASTGLNYSSDYYPSSNYTRLTLRNSEIYDNQVGLQIMNAVPIIERNVIKDNNTGIRAYSSDYYRVPVFANNFIFHNNFALNGRSLHETSPIRIDARNNWWGDENGPYFERMHVGEEDNIETSGNSILGDGVMFRPWLTSDSIIPESGCQENCFSNVMFLPGIKSSRLYKDGSSYGEDKLWPPNFLGNDLTNLRLSDDGTSLESVYTRDVIDEVAVPVVGGNIYKTFLEKLSDMKSDKTINDYETFAYDWRLDVENIAKNGTMYPDGVLKSAVDDLVSLANSSKSKKVTIIAHSNGGLLAKAIMQELENRGMAEKVDKIVLVGTPQMGTPLAILSLLYGYDESMLFGTLISRAESRTFAENMPGAYGLLPSRKYFDRSQSPLLTFSSSNSRYREFADFYDGKIENSGQLENFLTGEEGREKPGENDVENENVLNENLIDKASQMHDRLDNWTPPSNVEVIQIAGWGLDTISGVDYSEEEETVCSYESKIPMCLPTGKYLTVYDPKFTVDGDAVVVAPSALMMEDAPNVKKYWMDLFGYNDNSIFNREHKDVLELDSVKSFISSIIANDDLSSSLPEYLHASRPADYDKASPRLRMSLYSPLDIHLYDEAGNHTGPVTVNIDGENKTVFEEGIPNSYYHQFGDRKYVGFDKGQNIDVQMDGYAKGSYTLKLEEIKATENGDQQISHVTFANLPTTEKTTVKFNLPEEGIIEMTPLEADVDGDGENDYVVEKVLDGTATLDTAAPTISIASPENEKQYLNNQTLKFDYSAEDNISNNDKIKLEVLYDGKVLKSNELDLSLQKLGEHSFSIVATDEAGNKSEKKVDFKYAASFQTISQNVDHYYKLKLITDKKTRDFIQVKVRELMHVQNMIAKFEGKKHSKVKSIFILLKNKKIDELIKFINGKINYGSFGAREILIDNLNFLKN